MVGASWPSLHMTGICFLGSLQYRIQLAKWPQSHAHTHTHMTHTTASTQYKARGSRTTLMDCEYILMHGAVGRQRYIVRSSKLHIMPLLTTGLPWFMITVRLCSVSLCKFRYLDASDTHTRKQQQRPTHDVCTVHIQRLRERYECHSVLCQITEFMNV